MRKWPSWLEDLRPDEVTSARLRRSIAEKAAPLLEARRDDWWDVASRWAGLLTPVAAVLTLLFAGLAVRQGLSEGTTIALEEPAADVIEAVRSETVPAGFSEADFAGTDHDVVFAALGEAARMRPGSAPSSEAETRP